MSNTALATETQKTLNDFMAGVTDEVRDTLLTAMQSLLSSEAGSHAVNTGAQAPDFSLPNVKGGDLSLTAALQQGPVVLSFYRGGWCPFCNLEFHALQEILGQIRAHNASLIGISPELPDVSLSNVEKNNLQFDVLSDVGNKIARRYGLVMTVPEAMRPLYKAWGVDIPASNGDSTFELPIPATYVIDRTGKVRAAHVNKDYTQRMEPADILATLALL